MVVVVPVVVPDPVVVVPLPVVVCVPLPPPPDVEVDPLFVDVTIGAFLPVSISCADENAANSKSKAMVESDFLIIGGF